MKRFLRDRQAAMGPNRPPAYGQADGKDHIHKDEHSLPRICSSCGAISVQKRWFYDDGRKEEIVQGGRFEYSSCPGCSAARDEEVGGIVVLSGSFLNGRTEEFKNAIRHEEERQQADNPSSVIINMSSTPDSIVIRTANPFLALRIGKRIRQAYDGELDIVWTDDRLTRVYWSREG